MATIRTILQQVKEYDEKGMDFPIQGTEGLRAQLEDLHDQALMVRDDSKPEELRERIQEWIIGYRPGLGPQH